MVDDRFERIAFGPHFFGTALVHAQSPLYDVEPMGTEAGHLPAAKFAHGIPRAVGDVRAVRGEAVIVGLGLNLAAPHVPVEFGRNRFLRQTVQPRAQIMMGHHAAHFADAAIAHQHAARVLLFARPLLHARLQDPVVLLHGLGH